MRLSTQLSTLIIFSILLYSCNQKSPSGSFEITGNIKNIENQQVYLEQLFFNSNAPQVLDSGQVNNGKFTLHATSVEEGLFRVRFQQLENGYVFINDKDKVSLTADAKDSSLGGPQFSSPGNRILMDFLVKLDAKGKGIAEGRQQLEALKTTPNNDSMVATLGTRLEEQKKDFTRYVINFADTTSHPILAMFALGYASGATKPELDSAVAKLNTRFPSHNELTAMVSRYNQMNTQAPAAGAGSSTNSATGKMAPELTMNDVNGTPFSLSQLKGKYVLVDFWASWCAPCRAENPNVVAAYNTYKDKNFTVLGVSLDEKKEAWLAAIKKDNLTWKHISDLKGWNSIAVPTYNFNGIPYNVLVDPSGQIIASELRGEQLMNKLAEVLK